VQKIGCDVVGHHDYDTHAIIDDDIMTKAQTDKDIVREISNKNGKLDPEGGGGSREGGNIRKHRSANSQCESLSKPSEL
jgi:hypothetical protein